MKTILITGASDGLGKAIAKKCSENGMRVVNISRTNCEWGEVDNIKCDLSKKEDLENAISIIKEKYSDFDVLINNAAIVGYGELEDVE